MLTPEEFTPERMSLGERVDKRIDDIVSNVAARRELPSIVCIFVCDEVTGERTGRFAKIEYMGNSGVFRVSFDQCLYFLKPGNPSTAILEMLLEEHKGNVPLICDLKIAEELSSDPNSVNWVDDGHYRLQGSPQWGT